VYFSEGSERDLFSWLKVGGVSVLTKITFIVVGPSLRGVYTLSSTPTGGERGISANVILADKY
jgi:hypothetical protein